MQSLVISTLGIADDTVEVVERKGLGHPDTICDALAETLSRNLCREYRSRFGKILHHNVDKALLSGGRATPDFGGGSVLAPINIYLAGRAVINVGKEVIQGKVTRVDPAGFLKVSALGIEEQRVRTTVNFSDPPEAWSRLGHDYRVIVHVTIWSANDVLTVPVTALFRKGDDWTLYVVKNGRARATIVEIGHRNNRAAEVISGLSVGDQVILHPSDRVTDAWRLRGGKVGESGGRASRKISCSYAMAVEIPCSYARNPYSAEIIPCFVA